METTLKTQAPRNKGTPVTDAPPSLALAPDLLRKMDAYWRAANYLSVGQIYLFDNPLLCEPLKLVARQTAVAGPLGDDSGAELPLRPSESGHQGIRPEHDLHLGTRPRRAWRCRQRVPRGDLQRDLHGRLRGRVGDAEALQAILVTVQSPAWPSNCGAGRPDRCATIAQYR